MSVQSFISLLVWIIFIIIGLIITYIAFTAGLPFLLALLFAILLEPFIQWMGRVTHLKRPVIAAGVASLCTLLFFGAVYLIGTKIVQQSMALVDDLPRYIQSINTVAGSLIEKSKNFIENMPAEFTAEEIEQGVQQTLNSISTQLQLLGEKAFQVSFDVAKVLPGFLIMLIVFFVAFFLFSLQLPTMRKKFLSLFHDASQNKVVQVLDNLKQAIIGFIRAQIILSSLTFFITLMGLLILQVDYPFAIALIIIVVDILPIFGTGAVIVPWAFYLIFTGDMVTAIGLLVLWIIITIFRRSLEPKILGDSMGIGTLSTLISLYIGFKLVGLVGLFLGPVLVIVFQTLRQVGLFHTKIKF